MTSFWPLPACRRRELLPLRIPEDYWPYQRVPDPHDVLRRRDNLKEVPVSNQEVGCGRRCRSEALGKDAHVPKVSQSDLDLSSSFRFRDDSRLLQTTRKTSTPTTSPTTHSRSPTLCSCVGRSTSWCPITPSAILTAPRSRASTTFVSRSRKLKWRDITITGRQSGECQGGVEGLWARL